MPQPVAQWTELFGGALAESTATLTQEMLVFKKAGEPLLVIPRGVPSGAALGLYPAQSPAARLARFGWGRLLKLGLPSGAAHMRLQFDPTQPFIQFLQTQAAQAHRQTLGARTPKRAEPEAQAGHKPTAPAPLPFALLAGNPRATGRRFLLLLLDDHGTPLAVVKAGVDPDATALIDREAAFLEANRLQAQGLPRLLGRFESGPLWAFAMEFIEGNSPQPAEAPGVVALLESWLKSGVSCRLEELTAWQRLAQANRGDPLFRRLSRRLAGLQVQAPLFHGDFTPWNLKVSRTDGSWTALDWERGERSGPPAWDWFHYVLQPAVLVRRQSAAGLAQTAETFLSSLAFRDYAQTAGVAGNERGLMLAYLLYCRDVLRPAEGSPRVGELIDLVWPKWMS